MKPTHQPKSFGGFHLATSCGYTLPHSPKQKSANRSCSIAIYSLTWPIFPNEGSYPLNNHQPIISCQLYPTCLMLTSPENGLYGDILAMIMILLTIAIRSLYTTPASLCPQIPSGKVAVPARKSPILSGFHSSSNPYLAGSSCPFTRWYRITV